MSECSEVTANLFPSSLDLPAAYEGELLFSWCSRYHRLACNIRARDTGIQLFGNPSSGLHYDFPTPLEHFQARTRDHLGAADEVISQRTPFAFYRPFLPRPQADALSLALRTGSYGEVHRTLGLAASLPDLRRRLKACPECMIEDKAHRPTTWWRTEHQWPPMLMCLRHRQPLLFAQASVSERLAGRWTLPADIEDRKEWQLYPPTPPLTQSRLLSISEWSRAIVSESGIQLQTANLRYCYLLRAKELGYLAMDGSVRLAQLRDDFVAWAEGCAICPGLSFVTEVHGVNAGFLGQMLRQYKGLRHPLKHIVMMAYLYSSPDAFLASHKEVSQVLEAEGENGIKRQLTDIRHGLLTLVGQEKWSVNAAAGNLGVTVRQATRFLNQSDIPYVHRPRIVGTEKERALEDALRVGKDRAEICRELGIRKGYIKDYLATRPGLRATWEAERIVKIRQNYRDRFLKVLNENPSLPIKAIRRLPQNGFQWLYNHDRQWLTQVLPALWRRS